MTLLNPAYSVVVPQPGVLKVPLAYAMANGDTRMALVHRHVDRAQAEGRHHRPVVLALDSRAQRGGPPPAVVGDPRRPALGPLAVASGAIAMDRLSSRIPVVLVVAALLAAPIALSAGVKVRSQHDKDLRFPRPDDLGLAPRWGGRRQDGAHGRGQSGRDEGALRARDPRRGAEGDGQPRPDGRGCVGDAAVLRELLRADQHEPVPADDGAVPADRPRVGHPALLLRRHPELEGVRGRVAGPRRDLGQDPSPDLARDGGGRAPAEERASRSATRGFARRSPRW